MLAGKRVAMLGETAPRVRETFRFRMALLRFLATHGFSLIGTQASWPDGARIQRFLASNALTELDRVALLGYRGSARTDRDDSCTGSLSTTRSRPHESPASHTSRLRWQAANQAAMQKEQRRFYVAVRKLREQQQPPQGPIQVFGCDADYSLGDCYEEIDALLRTRRQPRIDTLRQLLTRVPGEDMAAEIDRLAWALDWLDLQYASLADQLGSSGFGHVRHLLALLHDSFELAQAAWYTDDPARIADGAALRDTVMHTNVAYALAEHHPEAKAVLIAAAHHLPKSDAGIVMAEATRHNLRSANAARGSTSATRASLGSFVAQTLLPGQVFSVWFMYGGGTDGQIRALKQRQLSAPKDSLNALLRRVGGAFVLPLAELDDPRAAPLRESLNVMHSGNRSMRLRLAEQLDAIYFVPTVSAVEAQR